MRRRGLLGLACAAACAPARLRAEEPGLAEVDLLLVLATDVSSSMRSSDLAMQRDGTLAALRDREVLRAVESGPEGAIGLAWLEWAGARDQTVLLPWTRLAGAADAARIVEALAGRPVRGGIQTSISGAIAASRLLLAAAPFTAGRRVIDISGDGENNHGGPAEGERDQALAEGITINGLPIVQHGARWAAADADTPLEAHYRASVIGGPGAFLLPAFGVEAFADAIRRKLVLEIAGQDRAARASAA